MNQEVVECLKNLNETLIKLGADPIAGIKFTPHTLKMLASQFDAHDFIDLNSNFDSNSTYADIPLIK